MIHGPNAARGPPVAHHCSIGLHIYYMQFLHTGNSSDIQTSNIIPVDLNSFLHMNARTLSMWFRQMGNAEKSDKYEAIATQFLKNINDVIYILYIIRVYNMNNKKSCIEIAT